VKGRPVWAAVAGVYLRGNLEAARKRLNAEDWTDIFEGNDVVALVSFEPGSEGPDAEIARALAVEAGEPVWLLRFGEDLEAAFVYEEGVRIDSGDDPWEVIARTGLPFARRQLKLPGSVTVVEGTTVDDVRAALRIELGEDSALHVETGPTSTIVYSDRGSVVHLFRQIARRLPHATLYLVSASPDKSWLTCRVVGQGIDEGQFTSGEPDSELDSIKGRDDPVGIAEALGVPLHLLWP
jgi:hypothetical protein